MTVPEGTTSVSLSRDKLIEGVAGTDKDGFLTSPTAAGSRPLTTNHTHVFVLSFRSHLDLTLVCSLQL